MQSDRTARMCKQTKITRRNRHMLIINLFKDHEYHSLDRSLRKIIFNAYNYQYVVNMLFSRTGKLHRAAVCSRRF